MIDPATGWFEISKVADKPSAGIANLFEMLWINRYPWPQQVVMDCGHKFMGDIISLLKNEYGINRQSITTRNPQANTMIELAHQTIHNMIRSKQIKAWTTSPTRHSLGSRICHAIYSPHNHPGHACSTCVQLRCNAQRAI
jgi:hypothetical protein